MLFHEGRDEVIGMIIALLQAQLAFLLLRSHGLGKVLRTKGGKSHLRRRKSTRVKQKFDKMLEVTCNGDRKRIMRMAPYLKRYKANPPK